MAGVTKNKTKTLHWFDPIKQAWVSILLILILILAAAVYRNKYFFDRLSLCSFKETKVTLSNQENTTYKGNKLLLSILTKPALAARFFKYTANKDLANYKDITKGIKTVGDEQITIRPLSLTNEKVVICLSETQKDSFKELTKGTKIDKYLPPTVEGKQDAWINRNSADVSNNLDFVDENISFKYPNNLFLYKDNSNIWLFTQKVNQKNIEMYSTGINLPSVYLKIIVQPNPQNFSPKQFYLYNLYSTGPKYVNGDLDIDLNNYNKFGIYSSESLPENLTGYGSYFVANRIYTKFKDKMLVIEGLQLDTVFASVISSLRIFN